MICWYCHWGWPGAIADIYERALADLDGDDSPLHFGPAHIVWEDENFAREHVEWCLEHFSEYARDLSEDEQAVVRWSLEQLLLLPDHVLEAEPEGYDGERPELFPPAPELAVRKV